jgi:hypothetical protein
MSDLETVAEQLRRAHLQAHDVPNALPWNHLKESEQAQWLQAAQHQQENA